MDKKTRIIRAVLKVISKKYFGEVTLDEIAEEAELAKGTLYLYFKDKEELFLQSVLFVIDCMKGSVEKNYDEKDGFFTSCEKIIKSSVWLFKKNPEYAGIIFILHNPNIVKNRQRFFEEIHLKKTELYEFLVDLVEKGKKSTEVRKDLKTEEIAFFFMSLFFDLIFRSISPGLKREKKISSQGSVYNAMNIFKNGVLLRKE
ncbi:TetR/AcrR family transcriptional regulator [candidate division WOR-3 bacterium]|nr:TetR/AcrR family transcriptional regulator [candidate division WOR-3 bacterium]